MDAAATKLNVRNCESHHNFTTETKLSKNYSDKSDVEEGWGMRAKLTTWNGKTF